MLDALDRVPEPILAEMIENYLRQWHRWSLRTFLKWSLMGDAGWWAIYQTENTIDRLEWLTDHGLVVRSRTRRGENCYRLAPGASMTSVREAVAAGRITRTMPSGPLSDLALTRLVFGSDRRVGWRATLPSLSEEIKRFRGLLRHHRHR